MKHLIRQRSGEGESNFNEVNIRPMAEMGIHLNNLSAIVIGDNLLSIIVIAQNGFGLSITEIVFAK